MTRGLRNYSLAAGMYTLVVFVGMLVLFGDNRSYAVWTDSALVLAAWAGTAALVWRARQGGVRRRAWIYLAAGLGSEAVAETIWWVYEAGLQLEVPFPGGPDIFYLLGYPLLAIGFYKMVPPSASDASRRQAVVDSVLVGASLLLISWVLLLRPIVDDLGGESVLEVAVYLAYPVLDVMIGVTALACLARIPRAGVRPLGTLAGALLVWVIGDSTYLVLELEGTYGAGYPTDIAWVLGYLALGVVALFPDRWFPAEATGRPAVWQQLVPLGVTFLALAIGLANAFVRIQRMAIPITVSAAILVAVYWRQRMAIKEIERLQQATERSAQSIRAIVEHSGDFVALYSAKGKLIFTNPASQRATGRTAEELEAMNMLDHFHPDDAPRAQDALRTLLQRPDRPVSLDLRFHAGDGSYRIGAITLTNKLDDPDLAGILVNGRDVTEDRRRQQEKAQREAEQGLARERQRLINGAAHVLTTPLTPALLNLYALKRETGGPLTDTQRELLDAIERSLKRLQRSAEYTSRAFRLQSDAPREAVRLDALGIWDKCVADAGVPVARTGAEGPVYVHADLSLLKDAFTAVLDYLKEAHKERLSPVHVQVSGQTLTIHVPEPRTGMPSDTVQGFMDPFSGNLGEGTGLELYTCRKALEANDGDLAWHDGTWVLSVPMVGEEQGG